MTLPTSYLITDLLLQSNVYPVRLSPNSLSLYRMSHFSPEQGCSSDLAIHFYSLSSDLKSDWNHSHEYQPQIQAYWIELAKKYNLYPHIAFQTLVISAEWDRNAEVWHIITKDAASGISQESTAKILISAHGTLDIPNYPNIPGLDTFKGIKFHSAQYDNSISLSGKRVGIIGNGASA